MTWKKATRKVLLEEGGPCFPAGLFKGQGENPVYYA